MNTNMKYGDYRTISMLKRNLLLSLTDVLISEYETGLVLKQHNEMSGHQEVETSTDKWNVTTGSVCEWLPR